MSSLRDSISGNHLFQSMVSECIWWSLTRSISDGSGAVWVLQLWLPSPVTLAQLNHLYLMELDCRAKGPLMYRAEQSCPGRVDWDISFAYVTYVLLQGRQSDNPKKTLSHFKLFIWQYYIPCTLHNQVTTFCNSTILYLAFSCWQRGNGSVTWKD